MSEIPVLLLAAGASTRMGKPKQLLPWEGQTLIEHQIKTLLEIELPVFVVLGAHASDILPHLENLPVNIILNKDWQKGMGSSISAGLQELMKEFPNAPGLLLTLLDQPLISSSHLKQILQSFEPGRKLIVASKSNLGWLGVPALFDQAYFPELIGLNGKEGAKYLIQKHRDSAIEIDFGDILEDMDTPEHYQRLLTKFRDQK